MISHKASIKRSARAGVSFQSLTGKDELSVLYGCWQNSFPCQPVFLENLSSFLAVGRFLAKRSSPQAAYNMAACFFRASQEVSKKPEVPVLPNVITEVTSCHLCCIGQHKLCVLLTKGRITQGCKCQETGIIWAILVGKELISLTYDNLPREMPIKKSCSGEFPGGSVWLVPLRGAQFQPWPGN